MPEMLAPVSDAVLCTLHDCARILALAERGDLCVVRGLTLARPSLRTVCSHVAGAPHPAGVRAEADAPVAGWLHRLLHSAGLLDVVGGEVRVAGSAYDWLAASPGAQRDALVRNWLALPGSAWGWWSTGERAPRGRDAFGRQLTAVALNGVRRLPDAPVPPETLLAGLKQAAERLQPERERSLPRARAAFARQAAAYFRFLVMDVLPRLGLLTLEPGPPPTITPTVYGRTVVASRPRAVPAEIPGSPDNPATGQWELATGIALALPLGAPAAATFELVHLADPVSLAGPAIYALTSESLARGLARGYDLAQVHVLLRNITGGPVPGPVLAALEGWHATFNLLLATPGYLMRACRPALADELRGREPYRKAAALLARDAAFIPGPAAGALFAYLRRSGYTVAPASAASTPSGPALAPLLRRTLPLISLATCIAAYRVLCRVVPGLAELDLDDLEAACLAALTEPERAAAARLRTSNLKLMGPVLAPVAVPAGPDPADVEPLEAAPAAPPPPAPAERSPVAGDANQLEARPAVTGATPDAAILAAIAANHGLVVTYVDTRGRVTERSVRPLRLETRAGRIYLVALCALRGDERTFRLDRIVTALPQPAG